MAETDPKGRKGMQKERLLVLVKPDGVERGLVGRVLSRFESAGFKLVGLKLVKASEELVGKHYVYDENWLVSVGEKTKKSYAEKGIEMKETPLEVGKRVRNMLMAELTRIPVVAIALEGYAGATEAARKIAGSTQPKAADPSTIRGMYSIDTYELADAGNRPVRNIVHVSENKEIGEKEVRLWFSDKELLSYKRADEGSIFGI